VILSWAYTAQRGLLDLDEDLFVRPWHNLCSKPQATPCCLGADHSGLVSVYGVVCAQLQAYFHPHWVSEP
jgi:hypothetical protein